jgi:hypothetical protein
VLAVHQSTHSFSPPGGSVLVTCNDTNGVSPQARATFTAVRGETYLIQAGGASGATGNLNLVISCVADNDCDGIANVSDNCVNSFNPTQADLDDDAQGDACDADIDGDGCTNEQERGPFRELGGDRNPVNPWDFYDVSGEGAIDFTDTLAVLGLFGTDTTAPEYILSYDRYAPNPAKPWRTALGIDGFGIDLTDALTSPRRSAMGASRLRRGVSQ